MDCWICRDNIKWDWDRKNRRLLDLSGMRELAKDAMWLWIIFESNQKRVRLWESHCVWWTSFKTLRAAYQSDDVHYGRREQIEKRVKWDFITPEHNTDIFQASVYGLVIRRVFRKATGFICLSVYGKDFRILIKRKQSPKYYFNMRTGKLWVVKARITIKLIEARKGWTRNLAETKMSQKIIQRCMFVCERVEGFMASLNVSRTRDVMLCVQEDRSDYD